MAANLVGANGIADAFVEKLADALGDRAGAYGSHSQQGTMKA